MRDVRAVKTRRGRENSEMNYSVLAFIARVVGRGNISLARSDGRILNEIVFIKVISRV